MMSEHINEITLALSKAQGEMQNAEKNKINPHFKSKYADLASILDACREPLSKNGLAITQLVSPIPQGTKIITMLSHISGQWIKSEMDLQMENTKMQTFGAAMSYARRYLLSAIVGISQDDDDGQSANESVKIKQTQKYLTAQQILTIQGMMSDEEIMKLEKFYDCSISYIPAEKYDAILNSYQKSRSKEVANV